MTEFVDAIMGYFSGNEVYIIVLDVLIMLGLAGFLLTIISKSTRARRKSMFVLGIALIYVLIKFLSLPVASFIFDGIMSYWVLLVVLIFINEFRGFFENIEIRFSSGQREATEGQFMRTIMSSVETLSNNRTGAIITIERNQSLNDYVEKAIILNADITEELIESIFNTQAPTHDGAVIIQDGKIACCGAYFPSTSSDKIAKTIGSRHRAALGISEIFDCLTIVVSEETGRISVTFDGYIERNLNKEGLQSFLTKYLD
jgi:diadenylate cyclase